MKKEIITAVLVFLIFIVFVSAIINGGASMVERSNKLTAECNQTNYFTIGDKGHLNRIYECPENTFKDKKD